jgi:glucokinase
MKAFAGIDLGGTDIKYGLIDSAGKILHSNSTPSHARKSKAEILDRLEYCARDMLEYASTKNFSVNYLGIGSPGTVDNIKGRILGHSPNIPDWKGTDISQRLTERLNLPVYVGNDANLMAMAETMFGAGRGHKDVFCTTVGTGIGGGLIVNRKLITGSAFSAGEFGHVPIVMNGKKCHCGLKGCLEAYASAGNLLNMARNRLKKVGAKGALFRIFRANGNKISVKEILDQFKRKDTIALDVVAEHADFLATGLVAVVHLFNPEAIIIGGGIADGGGIDYIKIIKRSLEIRVISDSMKNMKIVKARLGNKAGFIGAAIQKEDILP